MTCGKTDFESRSSFDDVQLYGVRRGNLAVFFTWRVGMRNVGKSLLGAAVILLGTAGTSFAQQGGIYAIADATVECYVVGNGQSNCYYTWPDGMWVFAYRTTSI